MFPTVNYALEANRFVPYSDYAIIKGIDLTGATCKMQVRDRPNGGTLRADVVPTVSVTTDGTETVSIVAWAIPEETMENMPANPRYSDEPNVLSYDIQITPGGGDKFVAFAGDFIVEPGVTE